MASITDIGTLTNPLSAPVFGGPSGWAAAVRDVLNSSDITVDARIAAHAAAADPHPAYLMTAEGDARYEAVGAVASHAAAPDPHTGYLTTARGDARYEVTGAVAAHAAAVDPHPTYLTAAEGNAAYSPVGHAHAGTYDPAGTASTAVTNHAAAADPHTGYQKKSERGAANGYAPLDASSKVPIANLPPMSSRSISVVSTATAVSGTANTDFVYLCSAALTATMPTAVGNTNRYTIKRTGAGTVTIATTASQTIDGAATFTLGVQYQSVDLVSDGANWSVI